MIMTGAPFLCGAKEKGEISGTKLVRYPHRTITLSIDEGLVDGAVLWSRLCKGRRSEKRRSSVSSYSDQWTIIVCEIGFDRGTFAAGGGFWIDGSDGVS